MNLFIKQMNQKDEFVYYIKFMIEHVVYVFANKNRMIDIQH